MNASSRSGSHPAASSVIMSSENHTTGPNMSAIIVFMPSPKTSA